MERVALPLFDFAEYAEGRTCSFRCIGTGRSRGVLLGRAGDVADEAAVGGVDLAPEN